MAKADPSPAPEPVPDIADDLADMLRRGRMIGVKRLARIEFIDEDGERSSLALPVQRDTMPSVVLTELQEKIVGAFRQAGRKRMRMVDVAAAIDEDEDPYGGNFKRDFDQLKEMEVIEGSRAEGGYRLKSK